jgi:hypothetical protein
VPVPRKVSCMEDMRHEVESTAECQGFLAWLGDSGRILSSVFAAEGLRGRGWFLCSSLRALLLCP